MLNDLFIDVFIYLFIYLYEYKLKCIRYDGIWDNHPVGGGVRC